MISVCLPKNDVENLTALSRDPDPGEGFNDFIGYDRIAVFFLRGYQKKTSVDQLLINGGRVGCES